ncbi:uncharacterized protein Z520_03842 [Fonsecaea multimorphosa CBS 102226]|uniref:Aspartate aminotransferase n=1 Tax=Fonsecaea multimorphosa CBS 102226 TaxID=1442371 RepID=A0A0D2IT77_9EURO|nr:uncharacterized protein Z520_03842 [Fonsecaea multimorphosa CBS 102226]KIY00157.1 hypothetical protein Z520_03842 [Fonsecaea multimorphosa CBS 102226]OAL27351.1 hypothetical protein AYO22_03626 [Fonsecaea multimorphosa]
MALKVTNSFFSNVSAAPSDPAFALTDAFKTDASSSKVSLGSGVYRDDDAKPWILPAVKKAKAKLNEDPGTDHEYLPIVGHAEFINLAQELLFGTKKLDVCSCIASVQCISGTGANHLGARFLADTLKPCRVWISDPAWGNHHLIWTLVSPNGNIDGGHIQQRLYPYYKETSRSFDFDGMMDTLEKDATEGDVVILHACAHNPTGLDPSPEQWEAIANLCERQKLFPFFDCAYQGFATGSLDADSFAIRHFLSRGTMEFGVAQSFAKNMGLYGERVGAFHLVTSSTSSATQTRSQLARLQRGEISTPPVYGARIAATVLGDPALFAEWMSDLQTMSGRIKDMRRALYDELRRLQTPGKWDHIVKQIGMFSYTGLDATQAKILRDEYSIYLLDSGRISIAGLNTKNVCYVASAIDAVVRRQI